MTDPVRVAVIGATGYTGFELARLLLRHPDIPTPTFFLRNGDAGRAPRCLSELFPQLRGVAEAPCRTFSPDAVAGSANLAFLATPHEASLEYAPELLRRGLRVVDLSGAFRFRAPETLQRWYGLSLPALDHEAAPVYGLPEFYADAVRAARLVANPGCYPTSVVLALRPLIEAGWADRRAGIVCDCKSGASGAGKEPKRETHFVEVHGNFRAYGIFTHRHTPEISEHAGLDETEFTFSTHLLPVARGILSTLYVRLEEPRAAGEVEALYRKFYAGRPMVRLWPAGTLPELQHVAHTNFCDIGFALDPAGTRLVVVSCLDNLGKGAAGQAVQNLNLMLGLEEDAGLR